MKTIEIKKSKFHSQLFKVDCIQDCKNIVENMKKEFKRANHVCWAVVTNGLEKCCDDGEPSGTAGLPILSALKRKKLSNSMIVVVRLFGGIKLGGGGLIRAYAKSAAAAIEEKMEGLHAD